MKIAVNTRLLLSGKLEGIGWFTYESLKRITQNHPEHEFIFIFDRPFSDEFIFSNNIIPEIAFPQARHPLLWYLFFDFGIPYVLRKHQPDIFLSPDGWLSLNTKIPSLSVIHDLNFFHNPEWIDKLPRAYYNYFFPRYIKRAARIATVSEFSKNDISSQFGISANLIDVVYNGVNTGFKPLNTAEIKNGRLKYTAGIPYFLFLGLVHPRKNLTRIIKAFEIFRKNNNIKHRLLVVGSTKYWSGDTQKAYENSPFREDIIFTGRLPHNELNTIIGSSIALVYTSLFEGFGIPILEAMQCEVPVITSNITAMPEVGGNAVVYADPYSEYSISEAMQKIANNEELRKKLIVESKKQLLLFTWDSTAEKLWESIIKTKQVR